MWKHTQIMHTWQRKETHEHTHKHTAKKKTKKQMALLHNPLLLFARICHFMLSLSQKKKEKGKEL